MAVEGSVSKREQSIKAMTAKVEQHRQRQQSRLFITIIDIEPQSKKMSEADKDDFQRQVLSELKGRPAFRGPLALSIDLSTTRKAAPQAHTIAKNLLDLLGPRRPNVEGPEKGILYEDDSQIHALSVACEHGKDRPMIAIYASPFDAVLDDLELAAEVVRSLKESNAKGVLNSQEKEDVATLRRLIAQENEERNRLGDEIYEGTVKLARRVAQRALLKHTGISTTQLAWLFGRPKKLAIKPLAEFWNEVMREAPIHIHVGELPATHGGSAAFGERITAELTAFRQEWDWLISPLVVPVGLEVIVRPASSMSSAVLHDLDNIVRYYLLPQVVPKFGTVTDFRWAIDPKDLEELGRGDPSFTRLLSTSMLPKATKSGITRYNAWRLPPASRWESAFVSVALVAYTNFHDLFRQIDDQIDRWAVINHLSV
jgi:hypothetical protein